MKKSIIISALILTILLVLNPAAAKYDIYSSNKEVILRELSTTSSTLTLINDANTPANITLELTNISSLLKVTLPNTLELQPLQTLNIQLQIKDLGLSNYTSSTSFTIKLTSLWPIDDATSVKQEKEVVYSIKFIKKQDKPRPFAINTNLFYVLAFTSTIVLLLAIIILGVLVKKKK